jgi:hypothetical protein
MNPTLERLARYVMQELERGVPEITLYSAMRESGWTAEWIKAAISTAKQRAVPAGTRQLNIPEVQPTAAATQLSVQPVAKARPAQTTQPSVKRLPPRESRSPKLLAGVRRALCIVVAVLSAAVIGLSVYRAVEGIQHAAQQKVIRDADRREDLSVLLSDLSDYFVAHNSYPTRTQMNTPSFLEANGFEVDSITDPKWSPKDEACSRDGKPALAGSAVPNCYLYEVTAGKNGICNNATTPCAKTKVSIWLEVDQKTYDVTFDKNTQVT